MSELKSNKNKLNFLSYEPCPQCFQSYHLKAQDPTRAEVPIPSPSTAEINKTIMLRSEIG